MKNFILLLRDELTGSVKSWMPFVFWLVFPLLGLAIFLLTQWIISVAQNANGSLSQGTGLPISASWYAQTVMTTMAGQLVSILACVTIVNEKNRKVFDLFVIRPIRPSDLLWAKFGAYFFVVSVGLVIAVLLGLVGDWVFHGQSPDFRSAINSILTNIPLIGVATAMGIVIGVISPSVLVGILVLLFGASNLSAIPALPIFLGGDQYLWLTVAISTVMVAGMMLVATVVFNRREF